MGKCVIFGASGHAISVIDAMLSRDISVPYAVLTSDRSLWGSQVLGIPIRGGDDLVGQLVGEGANEFTVAFGAIGRPQIRMNIYNMAMSFGLVPVNVIHASASVSRYAIVGHGCQILGGAIVVAGANLGDNVIINTGAIVEHGCKLGDGCFLATGAMLSGDVVLEDGVHIGTGATVRQGIHIGSNAIVGIGAAVVKDVEAGTTVVGVPARPI